MRRPSSHVARIHRVIDQVERDLGRSASVRALARLAYLSPFHFHRVFGEVMRETPSRFVQRVRLERAAALLIADPARSITEIAIACGFSSSAVFARAFRAAFATSASEWRAQGSEHLRKTRKARAARAPYLDAIIPGGNEMNVEIRELPALRVAYVRHLGAYAGKSEVFAELFARLRQWAGPRGLLTPESRFVSIAHDHPDITDEDKLRLSVCLPIPEGVEPSHDVNAMDLPGGAFAVARVEVATSDIPAAWQAISDWVARNGYAGDDRPCYEVIVTSPREHPEGKHVLELRVPVRART